jgi:hypothetical protein
MTLQTPRSPEAEAFLNARQHVSPTAVSACDGWTSHELTAHLAGIAVEISRHLIPYLADEPVPETRSFEEREAPLRDMNDDDLFRRLDADEEHARSLLDQVLAADPDAVIPWTGRQMAVAKFWPHLRNEFAIHRWDFVGDDDISAEFLAQADLTEHSVGVLGEILTRRGREHDPTPDDDLRVRLRAGDTADVCLVVQDRAARLEFAERKDSEPHVDLDPAARLLVIWGRRPDTRGRFLSGVAQPTLARLQAILSGY